MYDCQKIVWNCLQDICDKVKDEITADTDCWKLYKIHFHDLRLMNGNAIFNYPVQSDKPASIGWNRQQEACENGRLYQSWLELKHGLFNYFQQKSYILLVPMVCSIAIGISFDLYLDIEHQKFHIENNNFLQKMLKFSD